MDKQQHTDEYTTRYEAADEDRRTWFAERQALNGCALEKGWCMTHDTRDTMDHHFDVHPGAYND